MAARSQASSQRSPDRSLTSRAPLALPFCGMTSINRIEKQKPRWPRKALIPNICLFPLGNNFQLLMSTRSRLFSFQGWRKVGFHVPIHQGSVCFVMWCSSDNLRDGIVPQPPTLTVTSWVWLKAGLASHDVRIWQSMSDLLEVTLMLSDCLHSCRLDAIFSHSACQKAPAQMSALGSWIIS